jgi:hypothetical protein
VSFYPSELIYALYSAFPIHPLGVIDNPKYADGQICSPLQYFCHDIDHARFKIREDLKAVCGVSIPDAYINGQTFDCATGKHRTILPTAVPLLDNSLWSVSNTRYAFLKSILASVNDLKDAKIAHACKVNKRFIVLLLFLLLSL